MLIAFLCSITLVPAMLALLNPAGEPRSVGFKALAPLDDFLQRHRIAVIAGTILVVLAGTPLLLHLPFDFNPVNLQSPNAASVVTYRELQHDPETSGNDAEIMTPSLEQADATAKRLAALPEVARALTLSSFVPADQDPKIAALQAASQKLGTALNAAKQPAPSDQDVVAAIQSTAAYLSRVAGNEKGAGADAARETSGLLERLAGADAGVRGKAEAAIVPPLVYNLDQLRNSLAPQPVTIKTLPPNLIRDWVLPDGRARVEALPKGDANDTNVLRNFATAVLRAEPTATGPGARSGAAMSYDSAGHDAVLFGGETTPADSNSPELVGDTWTWNGSTWKQASPHTSPDARDWAGLGDDLTARGVVLVAGSGAQGALDDTWLWNGIDWTKPSTTGAPAPRVGAATAFGASGNQFLLFGGAGPGGTVLGGTAIMTTVLATSSGATTAAVSTTTVPPRSSRPSIRRSKADASSATSPSSVATTSPLAVTATTLRRGETVTLAGSGFGPGSTVTITFHSSPEVLGRVTADSRGSFEATVSVPDRAAGGAHHFEATGQNPSGRMAELVVAVDVIGVPARTTASPGQTLVMVGIALLLPLAAWLAMGGAGWARARRRRGADRAAI